MKSLLIVFGLIALAAFAEVSQVQGAIESPDSTGASGWGAAATSNEQDPNPKNLPEEAQTTETKTEEATPVVSKVAENLKIVNDPAEENIQKGLEQQAKAKRAKKVEKKTSAKYCICSTEGCPCQQKNHAIFNLRKNCVCGTNGCPCNGGKRVTLTATKTNTCACANGSGKCPCNGGRTGNCKCGGGECPCNGNKANGKCRCAAGRCPCNGGRKAQAKRTVIAGTNCSCKGEDCKCGKQKHFKLMRLNGKLCACKGKECNCEHKKTRHVLTHKKKARRGKKARRVHKKARKVHRRRRDDDYETSFAEMGDDENVEKQDQLGVWVNA